MKTQQSIEQTIGHLSEQKKVAEDEFDHALMNKELPNRKEKVIRLRNKVRCIDRSINALLWAIGMRDTVE